MVLQILCILFLIPAFLVAVYYAFLAIYALIARRDAVSLNEKPTHTFAIVIPAHNEEQNISNTLKSCAELDYPNEKYKVFVIADNCSDKTAEIARQNGANCLERFDAEKKGKGFALEWGFKQILPEGHDALVVLDADCHLEAHALRVFDYYLEKGEKVLQTRNEASNPDHSSISYVTAVGNLIKNELFYLPKSGLGLCIFLLGTGMVFQREVLEQYPWKSYSVVEDVEYTLHLLKVGMKVSFVCGVRVLSEYPAHQNQLAVQRTRWAKSIGFSKTEAFKLIWEGMIKGRGLLLDAGWTLLVLSRPLVLLELFVAVILGFLCAWLSPGSLSSGLLATGLIIILIQGLYFGSGVLLLGVNARRLSFLLNSPVTIGRLILISLLGVLGVRGNIWVRTPR
jgi:1,2-diacylglycerol 3-beta-glucosyltransferase